MGSVRYESEQRLCGLRVVHIVEIEVRSRCNRSYSYCPVSPDPQPVGLSPLERPVLERATLHSPGAVPEPREITLRGAPHD